MLKQPFRYYKMLFVSACKLARKLNVKDDFYDTAYLWISLMLTINITALFMFVQFLFKIDFNISNFLYLFVFGSPPLVINYYIFIRKKRYIQIFNNIDASPKPFMIYLIISLFLFLLTGYINIH